MARSLSPRLPPGALVAAGFTVVAALTLLAYALSRAALQPTAFASGWVLLLLLAFLALFNLRKKVPVLPLGSAASWLRLHVWVGWLSLVVFGVHLRFELANGGLELALATLYGIVFASGVLGLFVSRTVPSRLTTRGEPILFERIPGFRARLLAEVDDLVQRAATETRSRAIFTLYSETLQPFLSERRHLLWHLVESDRPVQAVCARVVAVERYASEPEQAILRDIDERVKLKADLDYQYAQQALLRGWLFVHVPATYSLLLVAAVHAWLAHAFWGAGP